ncbi:alkaline shock response membrane anchor protein AmaP [Acaricomes phytoseiuli]|uniref:hypothetical protein n=1 Tax=Acaricomes phytoseiuli TaxID=291968 RepID=UPI00035EAD2A|nr:hypothetical protein [Acaricomes phytoseiuli]MCW1250212.1 alkaline shock response membrane anchor protein AmaP [Acaricomes phytoseiuli]
MSRTHRGFNRFMIFLFSLLFLAAGAATLLSGIWPWFAEAWRSSVSRLWELTSEGFQSTTFMIDSWRSNWLWIAALAVILGVIVLLLIWIFSQGGGRTSLLLAKGQEGGSGGQGELEVRQDLASKSLKETLEEDTRILSTSVSTWDLGRRAKAAKAGSRVNALKVNVQSRKGASPREIAEVVETAVKGLDVLLGELGPVPVLITINAGARTGWSHQHRVN